MTQEDRDLLLLDLSARLPYRVKGIITYDKSNTTFTVEGIDNNVLHLSDAEECYFEDFKPYLRPMSSMTEEDAEEFRLDFHYNFYIGYGYSLNNKDGSYMMPMFVMRDYFDWLNAHHFDYRNLIEKGLAIAVTKENNPYDK